MASERNENDVRRILQRRVQAANVFPSLDEAVRRIAGSGKLSFYLGIDPTGPQLHLGHTIPLLLLADLARLGHAAVLLIGDFTARIGDPTGKDAARQALTAEQIAENVATYEGQVRRVVGDAPLLFRSNSEWLAPLTLEHILRLTGMVTVQQMLQRDMFQERLKHERPIHVSEFLYPLMQGYDSVALQTDGEVGGNDQTFNMLVGRDLEKAILGKDKLVLATRLLVDEATGKKMSKTEGTLIAVDDAPQEIRRKVLALDDTATETVFMLCTDVAEERIAGLKAAGPREFKEALAAELVRRYHGEEAVALAAGAVAISATGALDKVLKESGLAASASEAKRLIEQGGVQVNGQTVTDWHHEVASGDELQVGKGKFAKVK